MSANSPSKRRNVEDNYTLGKVIGEGNFSTVLRAVHKQTGVEYAVKVVSKVGLNIRQRDRLTTEIEILSVCNHPNIVNLVEHFESAERIYMVMQLKTGGELFDAISDLGYFTEEEAVVILKQVGSAVLYLHKKGIVHRDLKPENMLFECEAADAPICIADFGFAKFVKDEEALTTPCGTPGYVAPEIANSESYNKGVDMWSLGVIMYTLLCGFPPFYSDDDEVLLELIRDGEYDFPEPYWTSISDTAKDLVTHLLDKNTAKRYTIDHFMTHPWINGKRLRTSSESQQRDELLTQGLAKKKSELKNALNKSIAAQRDALSLRSASESTVWKKRQTRKPQNLTLETSQSVVACISTPTTPATDQNN